MFIYVMFQSYIQSQTNGRYRSCNEDRGLSVSYYRVVSDSGEDFGSASECDYYSECWWAWNL